MKEPHFLLIADSKSERYAAYEHEFVTFWQEHGRRPTWNVQPWLDVIRSDGMLPLESDAETVVRIESPARGFDVTRCLLEAGQRSLGPVEQTCDWSVVPFQLGRLIRPGLVHQGWQRVLEGLQRSFDGCENLRPLAQPKQIAEMFDKNATLNQLRRHQIPCPESIDPPESASELLEELKERRWPVAYVKLATGSSASGFAVVRPQADPPAAITSAVKIDGEFYNTLRLKEIQGTLLHETLDFILREGASVQKGIPMAQIQGENFDVRVVVIYGEPAFTIFRLSKEPMTNLHLGGRRGDPTFCRAQIPQRAWLDAIDHCVEAAALYDSAVVGVDLIFERSYMRHYILELNAFGDFFPGWTNQDGKTVHRYEIEATARRFGWIE